MTQVPPTDAARTYTVVSAMTEHGGMTVVDPESNRTYQIVAYNDGGLRRELAARDVGESVTVDLDRAGVRANVWRASRPEPIGRTART